MREPLRPTRAAARRAALALAGMVVVVSGSRAGLPGVRGEALRGHIAVGGPLWLYDRLAGGALSAGALLALGAMPYLSARLLVRLARAVVPALASRARRRTWTRALTATLALVQAWGFARFAESVPGVVARPGWPFVLQTVALLVAGALFVAWFGERTAALAPDGVARAEAAMPPRELGAGEAELERPGRREQARERR